ncbi:putative endo-1,3-beta-glucanase, partial [Globisporangium splendens]
MVHFSQACLCLAAALTTSSCWLGASAQLNLESVNVTIAPKADFQLFASLSTEAPPTTLFPYTDAHKTFLPPRFMAAGLVGSKAIPTNNWWGNMIAATTDAQVQPAWVNPYTVRPSIVSAPYGLSISYPYPTRGYGGSTGNGNANKFYLHGIIDEFVFSATEFTSPPAFEIYGWDDLSVQLRFSKGSTKFESTLVSGMAFATAKYAGLTPSFSTAYAIISINGQNAVSGLQLTSDRFVMAFNNGQTWTLYFSTAIALRVDGVSKLVGVAPFTGTSRVALIPTASVQTIFDQGFFCVLEGGDVEAKDENSYSYNWKTSGNCGTGLLHYAQIHHVDTLDRTSAAEAGGVEAYSTTRGKMTALLTKTSPPVWRFTDTTSIPVDFFPPRKPSASVVAAQNLKAILTADIRAAWSLPLDGSYYFNGKAAQKYASLCLMASDSSVVGTDTSLRTECVTKLENILVPFLANQWANSLYYDTIYRGILSSQGFKTNDANADFGNTMYNDHHYHYGYWITTAAIVNYLDPAWSRISELNRMAGFMIRDVANPSWTDAYFPKFRNFDWYRGHSYSHGVTPFADGKDQESTSEDINFHYGLTLFGQVTNNPDLTRIGKLMLKLDTRAIQTYFLMTDANQAQPAQIRPNKVTGIMFDNKIDYATWFSAEKYAIHGIQMIPISPVTEFVRTRQFVEQEWNQVLSREAIIVNNDVSNTWMSLLYANYATVNKDVAMAKLQTVAMDDGLTRSWALYMAATRP